MSFRVLEISKTDCPKIPKKTGLFEIVKRTHSFCSLCRDNDNYVLYKMYCVSGCRKKESSKEIAAAVVFDAEAKCEKS